MNATSDLLDTSDAVRLAPSVYFAVQHDTARLLDLEQGRFFGLDAVATRLLSLALAHGRDRAAAIVAGEHRVWFDDVRADLQALLNQFEQRGLIAGAAPTRRPAWLPLRWLGRPARAPAGVPSRRLVGRLLRRAWLSLRVHGWAASLERWGRPVGSTGELPACRAGLIEVVDRAVRDAAARMLLFHVACKEKALVAYHLLRAVYQLPADLVLGVEHYPFLAHAWVEIDGRVVTDDPGRCERFVPVARYGDI